MKLLSDGTVKNDLTTYSSINSAMNAMPLAANSTSNAWQFWSFFDLGRNAWSPLEHLRAKLKTQQQPYEIKTSKTHPLRIDEIHPPSAKGKIGLTFCPGKICDGLYGGRWERDLDTDIEAILAWGGKTLITLMETHEFEILGVAQFPMVLKNSQLNWLHIPIKDMQAPDSTFEATWAENKAQLYEALKHGDSFVIHCRGGLGRTGLLAARILTELGVNPVRAIQDVRDARPNSIETYDQECYVLTQAWKAK